MDDNAMPNATQTKKTRSSRGRQRIEIKKLENESKRQVTFSKRRKGLFKKAKALSTLCGVEVGIVTISKSGRFYATDNIDAILETESLSFNNGMGEQRVNGEFGLDQPIEKFAPEKLMEYAAALRELRGKAAVRLEELSVQPSSSVLPFVAGQQSSSLLPFVAGQQSSSLFPFVAGQQSSSLLPFVPVQDSSSLLSFVPEQDSSCFWPFFAVQDSSSLRPLLAEE
ncbi:MADS-box protein FLOWERING LOCUS C [Hibiscus syriacus]|uniref:MADS-box protein FLOWERING LOCUS C n=1 Tax=Hibiscus syriacus TaxID=106335 RepID=A0A6A3C9F9_HIBSY|nr:MADS-box transcription factor 22-like [Hibiscus syriacus]KAE8725813.1 MADS-box protein FLOWERING LOCUS C [Hibiscus syriacus]